MDYTFTDVARQARLNSCFFYKLFGEKKLVLPSVDELLIWDPESQTGFYPVNPEHAPYDQGYFDKYSEYAKTDLGRVLREGRFDLVSRHHQGELVDIGIGCGDFIAFRNDAGQPTFGHDINLAGKEWLLERGIYRNPFQETVEAISLWDVLEHITFHDSLLERVRSWVFVSVPIFTGPENILSSKHFRRDEHCWYWTEKSIQDYMAAFGFATVEVSYFETEAGRESIASFAFRRTHG